MKNLYYECDLVVNLPVINYWIPFSLKFIHLINVSEQTLSLLVDIRKHGALRIVLPYKILTEIVLNIYLKKSFRNFKFLHNAYHLFSSFPTISSNCPFFYSRVDLLRLFFIILVSIIILIIVSFV